MIFRGPLKDVTKADIDRLIANQVPESVTLDYKRELGLGGNKNKEFLADVTAFNNTQGGLLIFGVQEEKDEDNKNTGLPDKVIPLTGYNPDSLTLQIESIIREGTEPALTTVELGFVPYGNGIVLLLRVPPNYGTPRMVTLGKTNKFYRRTAGGKYLPDVYELEEMFMQSGSQRDRLVAFHRSRLEELKSSKIFPNVMKTRFLFLHVLPLAPGNSSSINFNDQLVTQQVRTSLSELFYNGYETRFNIDGYQVFSDASRDGKRGKTTEYSQCFRNGGLEVYSWNSFFQQGDEQPFLYFDTVDGIIENALSTSLTLGALAETEPPYVVKMTLICGESMGLRSQYNPMTYMFDREKIEFPDVVLMKDNLAAVKKDLGDLIWQAAGVSRFK